MACILTYIIPAGSYDFAEDGKTVVDGTFHTVEPNRAGVMDFFESIYKGFSQAASTMFVIFLIGGALNIMQDTGSISAAINATIRKTSGSYRAIIPVMIVILSVLGVVGAGNNVSLAFALVMCALCRKLKLDKCVAIACLYLASNTGFAFSFMNPFTTLLGQNIAGIPQMSGLAARAVSWAISTAIVIWFTMRYCARIRRDPGSAIAPFTEEELAAEDNNADSFQGKMTVRHALCLAVMAGCLIVFAYGSVAWDWGIANLGHMMVILAMAAGIIGGMSANAIAKSFVNGCKTMVYSAVITGIASGISVILSNANIIHTIIYYLAMPLSLLPTWLSSIGMFIVNFFFNFFVNSGSGQCYVVMPIMAPLADLIGVSRQIAVSAFQFGDGISNAIYPTSALLMGTIAACGISYQKWLKFVMPVIGILSAFGAVFLAVMTLVGWA